MRRTASEVSHELNEEQEVVKEVKLHKMNKNQGRRNVHYDSTSASSRDSAKSLREDLKRRARKPQREAQRERESRLA